MAVFNGSVKTPRQVADPRTDKCVSSVASLILPAVNTSAALLYPGSDVSVVHGIQHLQVDNDRVMRVSMNQDVSIGMNELYLVGMNRSMTVMANYTRDVMADSTIHVTGNYAKSVLSNYSKSITGNSVNTITGNYSKAVTANYSKSVTGNADNQIAGNYSKSVQSTYTKAVTGTATTTVTGDYAKILQANYSKSITGKSAINVTGTSNENYTGDHSRMYANNHKTYIVGDDNHTTLGSTLHSKVGPKAYLMSGPHHQGHDDVSQDDREGWFKWVAADGLGTAEQLELIGFGQCFAGAKLEVCEASIEGTSCEVQLGEISHAYKVEVNHGIVIKSEEKADQEEIHGLYQKLAMLTNTVQLIRSDTAIMHEEIGAIAERGEMVNLFMGVLFGANQFCM